MTVSTCVIGVGDQDEVEEVEEDVGVIVGVVGIEDGVVAGVVGDGEVWIDNVTGTIAVVVVDGV